MRRRLPPIKSSFSFSSPYDNTPSWGLIVVCLAVILILVSQRADDDFVRIFGTTRMKKELAEQELRQRGQTPSKLELIVVMYVIGFVWEEVQEIFAVGMKSYLRNMWNFIDFLRNSLYVSVMCLR